MNSDYLVVRIYPLSAKNFLLMRFSSQMCVLVLKSSYFLVFRDEGVVLKDLGSKWEPGDRSGKWLKLKPEYVRAGSDLDVLIIGVHSICLLYFSFFKSGVFFFFSHWILWEICYIINI